MTKFFTFFAALLFTQLLSAQSLAPAGYTTPTHLVTKPNIRMSNSAGELSLKTSPPATGKSVSAEEYGVLEVFPNPASGQVNYRYEAPAQGKVTITLTNSFGQKLSDVYSGNYNNGKIGESINLTDYAAGMYFINIKFTDAEGKLHTTNRKFQII